MVGTCGRVKTRPRVVKVLRQAMLDHVQRRLSSSGSNADVVSEVVRICAWMEEHDTATEFQWRSFHQQAQEKLLHATATTRLTSLVDGLR